MADAVPNSGLPRPSVAYRWLVLFFLSMAMFGNYYIFDSINPLVDIFKHGSRFHDAEVAGPAAQQT